MKKFKKKLIIIFSIFAVSLSVFFVIYKNRKISANENQTENKKIIKYVEFNPTYESLREAMQEDIKSHNSNDEIKLNWIQILSFLATKYGGNFSKYKKNDLIECVNLLKSGQNLEEKTQNPKLFNYYLEAYGTILAGFLGEIEYKNVNGETIKSYGLKTRCPISKGYPFTHYDDFGARRTFGYSRPHLGHDMFCAIGTPVVAIEDGYVEIMGWNKFGGWRIGIRSHDKKRYWYYAHLRKNKPFHPDLKEGANVRAGEIIGFVGRTGYSSKENVNNIERSHLHVGLQLIFDESQKDSTNEIWISLYNLIKLLS